jgi:hypothetical protein
MFEKVLEQGEIIEMQEECSYCGEGAMASVKMGYVVLTNRRFLVCNKKMREGKIGALL